MPSQTKQKGRFTVITNERTPTPKNTRSKTKTPTPKNTRSKTKTPTPKNTKKVSNEEDVQELVCKMKQVLKLIKNTPCVNFMKL